MQQTQSKNRRSFRVGRWLVQPDLKRVSDDGAEIQLEPRVMDLLIFLADRPGEVLSRQEILDAVWQQDFVGDSTLSSAVAVLRRALNDDVRAPRYIETIAKRGYRLVAEVVDAEVLAEVTPFPGLVIPHERSPYPGLAAFTESDTEHFFGREEESSALWEKIRQRRMLAVIGPSGVGKSSFVRAGVMPAAPEGWGTLVFAPGSSPFSSLARALAPEFAGNAEAVEQLLACRDADGALALVSRWRERWDQALMVVDQFEELFTLSEDEGQREFAELLSRLVSAGGAHVLLVLRDDFLYECHAHAGLAPVFEDLTVLGPLTGEGLRRAAVEPARHQGYGFDDDSLAGEMIDELAGERGATPMLAFTLSRLWELRDRERKLITRGACERIGGVTGALAHHAEEVLVAIGDDRQSLVREIFRNLVTAQGTRATLQVDELLSVFQHERRKAAAEVLRELVNGRLLTAFEDRSDDRLTRHRVEIAHESLLSAWPRLVRWQTQDADAALLRDQVRQAAQLWHDQGRSEDLLWTGAAFQELRLWQERYPGGLSTVEQAFIQGSTHLAGRRRRRRRSIAAMVFLAIVALSAVMTGLWWRGVREARRADAKQHFLEGKVDIDYFPVGSFSEAVASLEMADDPDVRRFALEALWRVPMPVQVLWTDSGFGVGVDFSPDGRFMAIGYIDGTARIWSAEGGEPVVFRAHLAPVMVRFSPDSRFLACMGVFNSSFRFFSVPEGEPVSDFELGGWPPRRDVGDAFGYGNMRRLVRIVPRAGDESFPWTVDASSFQRLARLRGDLAALDPEGGRMVITRGGRILAQDKAAAEPRMIADHHLDFEQMALHPDGELVASIDTSGEVQLWSLTEFSPEPVRVFKGDRQSKCWDLGFDATGSLIAATQESGRLWIWGMDDPPDADPLRIIGGWGPGVNLDFDPSGSWLGYCGVHGGAVWPVDRRRFGYILRGHTGPVEHVAFSPDASFLVSAAVDGEVRLWPMDGSSGERSRVLCRVPQPAGDYLQLAVAGDGSWVAVTTGHGAVRVAPVGGGPVRDLQGFTGRVLSVAASPDGRQLAAGAGFPNPADGLIRLWDMETGEASVLDAGDRAPNHRLEFTGDGGLLTVAGLPTSLHRWDLASRERELVLDDVYHFGLSRSGKVAVVRHLDSSVSLLDLTTGATVPLTSHGDTLTALAITPDGRTVVTGDENNMVHVGPADGSEPHLLYGHKAMVRTVAVSPDGQWIASGSRDCTVRIWPMPSGTPLHTLPYEELLEKLRDLQSYRRVPSTETLRGFDNEPIPFRGWQDFPEW